MINKHSFFQNSQCVNSYLHRFKIQEEYDTGVLEVCEICHMRKFFKILNGRADNQTYMSWHIKQALPTFHPWYQHQYE